MDEFVAETEYKECLTLQDLEAAAAEKGLVVILPLDNEIMLDIDDDERSDLLEPGVRVCNLLSRTAHIQFKSMLVTQSAGGNRHVYYRVNRPLDPLERIVIQAVLGSDPMREAISYARLVKGSSHPTAMFETEDQAKNVLAWRKRK